MISRRDGPFGICYCGRKGNPGSSRLDKRNPVWSSSVLQLALLEMRGLLCVDTQRMIEKRASNHRHYRRLSTRYRGQDSHTDAHFRYDDRNRAGAGAAAFTSSQQAVIDSDNVPYQYDR